MHIYNTETGVVELADVPIPKFLDIEDFESNVIDKQLGATVDIDTYNADLARITTIGAQNPNADFSYILSNYEKGGKQYNKLAEKIQKIKNNFAAKDWNPSLKQLGTKMVLKIMVSFLKALIFINQPWVNLLKKLKQEYLIIG